MTTRRKRLAGVLIGLVGVGAVALTIALILTVPPAPVGLASPPPSPGVPVASGSSPNGDWLAVGSSDASSTFVGYRAQEKLGLDFITWPNEAVGRTGGVTGRLEIRDGILQVADIEADLRALESDHPDRDGSVAESALETARFPTARFRLTEPVSVSGVERGAITDIAAHGELTIKGVTKPVVWPLRARWDGDTIEVAGQLPVHRLEYGVDMPRFLVLRVADDLTLEAQLRFRRECIVACASPGPVAPGLVAFSPSPSGVDDPLPSAPTIVGGGQIAVGAPSGDRSQIYIVDLDTGGLKTVTTGDGDQFYPFWSPGGDRLGYAQVASPAGPGTSLPQVNLVLAHADGSRPTLISNPDSLATLHPSMSPDGKLIAFYLPDDTTGGDIWVSDLAGRATQLTHDPGAEDQPRWSPDGRRIAYTRFAAGTNREDIWVMNSDGNDRHAITTGDGYEDDPAWSPDGKRIAYVQDGHIATMDADGSAVIALTAGTKDSNPTWSPDGKHLAFIRDRHLVVMRSDGSELQGVDVALDVVTDPAWRP